MQTDFSGCIAFPDMWSHLFMFCGKSYVNVSIKKHPTILIFVCWPFFNYGYGLIMFKLIILQR